MEVNSYNCVDLLELFVVGWGFYDVNVLGVIEILVKEGESPDPVIRAGKELDKIAKFSPRVQCGRRGTTIEVKIRVADKLLGPPKDLFKGLIGSPFILIS